MRLEAAAIALLGAHLRRVVNGAPSSRCRIERSDKHRCTAFWGGTESPLGESRIVDKIPQGIVQITGYSGAVSMRELPARMDEAIPEGDVREDGARAPGAIEGRR